MLYDSSQAQICELQAKLDSQKRKRRQLEEEVSSSQAHNAELTAILKSAVRMSSVSGQAGVGVQSPPRSGGISPEGSLLEVGPRLRSKELQGSSLTPRTLLTFPPLPSPTLPSPRLLPPFKDALKLQWQRMFQQCQWDMLQHIRLAVNAEGGVQDVAGSLAASKVSMLFALLAQSMSTLVWFFFTQYGADAAAFI